MRVFLWFSHHFFHLKRREKYFLFFFLNSEKSTAKNRKIVGHNTYTHRSNIWRRIEKKKKKKYGHSCWAFICVCTYIVRDEERTKGVALPAGRPSYTDSLYLYKYILHFHFKVPFSSSFLIFLYSSTPKRFDNSLCDDASARGVSPLLIHRPLRWWRLWKNDRETFPYV